jgi:hypothetical protein
LTYRTSLRDIETCLNALKPKLYHAGFRGTIARNTLAGCGPSHAPRKRYSGLELAAICCVLDFSGLDDKRRPPFNECC